MRPFRPPAAPRIHGGRGQGPRSIVPARAAARSGCRSSTARRGTRLRPERESAREREGESVSVRKRENRRERQREKLCVRARARVCSEPSHPRRANERGDATAAPDLGRDRCHARAGAARAAGEEEADWPPAGSTRSSFTMQRRERPHNPATHALSAVPGLPGLLSAGCEYPPA